jgi:hypothetical protein
MITEHGAANIAARKANTIREFLDTLSTGEWTGTAGELAAALAPIAERNFTHVPCLRVQPFLLDNLHIFEASGWEVIFDRTESRRLIAIRRGG